MSVWMCVCFSLLGHLLLYRSFVCVLGSGLCFHRFWGVCECVCGFRAFSLFYNLFFLLACFLQREKQGMKLDGWGHGGEDLEKMRKGKP